MRELLVVVRDPTGLHARPASALSQAAKRFASSVRARHGSREADVKRLISLLALGAKRGGEIRVSIEGPDEEEACRELENVVANGWDRDPGEELLPPSALHLGPAASSSSRLLRGVPAAAGVSVGRTHRPLSPPVLTEETAPDLERERRRLAEALEAARRQIAALSADARRRAGGREAAIFELRRGFLNDPEILRAVHAGIDSGQSAAAAWKTVLEREAATLDGLDDPLLASRAADVRDTGDQVLRLLLERAQTACCPETPVILLTGELNPSDFSRVDRARLLGIAAARGTPTSHGAILARAFGVPAVIGLGEALADLPTGVEVVLDGDAGTLLVEPRPAEVEGARERQASGRAFTKVQRGLGPTTTSDGHLVEVLANVAGPAEVLAALDQGAAGVGLLRTEFLFSGSSQPPTEEEQFAVYREMALALQGRPLTVRTLDAGGDKPLPYLSVPGAGPPSLGLRGLRLSLMRPEMLRTQLRAILRAADSGPLKVMFPMVSDLEEWRSARTLLEQARAECGSPVIEAGIMVEVPSCALLADAFAPEVDFFSIGTNDLTQYTLAADRSEACLRAVADGLHPAILRLIHQTVSSAHAAGKSVTVCGELAADAQAVPILVGIGVDALSVSPSAIPAVASQLRQLTLPSARQLAERALASKTAADVRKLVASVSTRSADNAVSSRFDAYHFPQATAPSRTWAWNLYGAGLERLGRQGQPEEIPLPQTRHDQLLVRVDAVSLCYSDVKVLKQGSQHPKLLGRDLAAEPTRLGHEVALTVIEVGEALRHRFCTGQRLALQPDIYHQGTSCAYGYTIPGGLVQHQLLGPEVLEGDGGCPLVPVGEEEIAYAEIALSEPWACVEAAYTQRRRLVPKPGGILWIRGRPGDQSAYDFSHGLEAPATIVGTDLPASLRAFVHEVCARSGARLVERNGLSVAQYPALAAELTRDAGFDDIVLLEPLSSEVVAEAAKLVARRGTVNLVGREPLDAPVPTDAGRIHYDCVAFVGSRGPDIAASYGAARNRCELRPGGTLLVVGAAGPMGQMHVARALEHPAGPGVVLAADVNPARLAVLRARCQPVAERSGKRLMVIESSQGREELAELVLRETRGNGVDDVVVCAPDGALASDSARLMKCDGMLVLFAGVPRGTVVPFDLSSVYLGNAQLTGTSGSTLADQVTVLQKASAGQLVLGRSVAAVGGMEAAPEGLRAVMESRYPGKVVLFPQLRDLPLTPLSRLEEVAPEAAEELTDAGEWSFAAERALIAKYWKP